MADRDEWWESTKELDVDEEEEEKEKEVDGDYRNSNIFALEENLLFIGALFH